MAEATVKRFKVPNHWTIGQRLDYFTDKSAGADACWPWRGTSRRPDLGYGTVYLKGRGFLAHRLVWEQTHGLIPADMDVCHDCDNPPCCNPAHLFLGTNDDNVADKMRKKRHRVPIGEQHGNAVLTEAIVLEIRRTPGRIVDLAERFGVSFSTISRIRRRKYWKHL